MKVEMNCPEPSVTPCAGLTVPEVVCMVTFAPFSGDPATRTSSCKIAVEPIVTLGTELVSVTESGSVASESVPLAEASPLVEAVRTLEPGAEVLTNAQA